MRSFDGGEVSIELGEEREEHVFTEPTVVCVPKGTPHGPVKIRKVGRPIAHYLFGLDPVYSAEAIPDKLRPTSTVPGQKYADLVHPLRTNVSVETIAGMADAENIMKDDPGFLDRAAAAALHAAGRGRRALCQEDHGPREWRRYHLDVR